MKTLKKWMAVAGVGMAVMLLAAVALPAAAAGIDAAPTLHGGGIAGGPSDQYLADALGVSVEDLQAAQQAAAEAGLQQVVDQGLITQEQADAIQERSTLGRFAFGGHHGFFDSAIDPGALLADALGVTVEQLQAARQTAMEAQLAQAVADGRITQEQADLMQARQQLKTYLDEQGLEDTLRTQVEAAVQQAVQAGVITQEQADAFLSNGLGFGKHGGMRGFEGMGGRGSMRGFGIPGETPSPGIFQRGGGAFGSPNL